MSLDWHFGHSLVFFYERSFVAQASALPTLPPTFFVRVPELAYRGSDVPSGPNIIYAIARTSAMALPISNILVLSTATSSLNTNNPPISVAGPSPKWGSHLATGATTNSAVSFTLELIELEMKQWASTPCMVLRASST